MSIEHVTQCHSLRSNQRGVDSNELFNKPVELILVLLHLGIELHELNAWQQAYTRITPWQRVVVDIATCFCDVLVDHFQLATPCEQVLVYSRRALILRLLVAD